MAGVIEHQYWRVLAKESLALAAVRIRMRILGVVRMGIVHRAANSRGDAPDRRECD